jgi:hypothetical protein
MPPLLKRTLRHRWFISGVHACLWLLLYLAVTNLGGRAREYHAVDVALSPLQSPAPVAGLVGLFSPTVWSKSLYDTNLLNPFFTRYFVPPAPPPPTTRKIEVTYHGFYQSGDGAKQAIFKLDQAYGAAPIGARIANDLYIANAVIQALTLTNHTAETNIVPLNAKKEITIPIQ